MQFVRNISKSLAILFFFLLSHPVIAETDTHERIQWADFGDRTVEFSGYRWRVKSGGLYGPGNNYFSDSKENVWVDEKGRLHLKISQREGKWYCSELTLEKPLGYGEYIFKTVGRVDKLDKNVILGFFLWEYQESYEGSDQRNVASEFDIEFGTWKDPNRLPGQFICQPWHKEGNESHFKIQLKSDQSKSSHAFRWEPDAMICRSWHGHSDLPFSSAMIHTWTYRGEDLPRPGSPRVHLNFWCIEEPPSDLKDHEVILAEFKFIPLRAER